MNYGPLIFLAAFFALSTSWFGLVLSPQLQVGRMQQTNTIPDGLTYPLARSGLARQGLDVYRANGCAYCHSQQARQSGTLADVLVTDAGTNEAALVQAILNLKPDTTESAIKEKLPSLPFAVKEHVGRGEAESALKGLNVVGAKAELWVVPVGPDMARYWGKRHSVAEDFLYDYPVMPGSQRIGPDLANVGLRWPDANCTCAICMRPAWRLQTHPCHHTVTSSRNVGLNVFLPPTPLDCRPNSLHHPALKSFRDRKPKRW